LRARSLGKLLHDAILKAVFASDHRELRDAAAFRGTIDLHFTIL
jgi:hypothetical protein